MLVIDCFNHNIYINDKIVGYIGENQLLINGKVFADLSDDGIISISGKEIAFVDDDGSIISNGKEIGYIDSDNNFIFHKNLSINW